MARKQRVNTKFLIILSVIVVVFGAAAIPVKRYLMRPKPEKFIAAGDTAFQAGKFQEAAGAYLWAVQLNQQDAPTLTKLGRSQLELIATNPEMVAKARGTFERALEVDPSYVPALEELLNYYISASQIQPSAEFFEKIRDDSSRILKLDPNNKRAQAYQSIATIQGWLFGVETEPSRIDEQVVTLGKLMLADPLNPELPFYIAQAKVRRGQELDRQMQSKEAEATWADAAAVFDKPLADHSDLPEMYYRSGQVFASLALADSSHKDKYLKLAKERHLRAIALAKQDDPELTDFYLNVAEVCAQQGDQPGAEKAMRELLEKRPDEQRARLELARLTANDPTKRQEMIDLLSKPVTVSQSLRGMKSLLVREYRLHTLLQLANLRLDMFATSQDAKEREQLLALTKENYKTFTDEAGETPEALKLKGKMQLLQKQNIDAIQTLSRAVSIMQQQGRKDYELMYILARAYAEANQTGLAKGLLTQVLDRYPAALDARLQLTQILIRENALADAKTQLETLEKQAPKNPDVIRTKMVILAADGKRDDAKKNWAALPEGTRQEKLVKAQTALMVGDFEGAISVLEKIVADDPNDVESVINLARLYAAQKKQDKGLAILQEALKKNPESKPLQVTIDSLKGMDASKLIETYSDDFSKEVNLAKLALSKNDHAECEKHLAAAAKLKPNDPTVMDMQFQLALLDRKWDVAEALIEPLSKANDGRGRDEAGGLLYRFRLAMAKGDTNKALDVARELTSKLPEFAQSWLSLAQALHASGQFDQAAQKYVLALEKQNGNPDAMRGIIDCYYRLNKPDDARRYIMQARQTYPNDPYFRDQEINYNLNFGDPEKAVAPREEMVAKDSKNEANVLSLGSTYLRVAQAKAPTDQAASDKFLQKASKTFDDGKKQWPDDRLFYGYLADCAMVKNDTAGAEKYLKELAARDAWKDKPEPQIMLAELYTRTGKLDQAEKCLRDAMTDSKNSVEVQSRLAGFLAQQRKTDAALKVLELANAGDPRIQRQRIDVEIAGAQYAQAEKEIQALLAKTPGDTQLLSYLTIAYMNTGKYDLAVERANQLLTQDPKNIDALLYRGLVRLNQGKFDDAITDLANVRDMAPQHVDARLGLADCYRRRNEPEGAARELEAALKVIPLNKVVRLRLIELYITMARWSDADRLIADAKSNPQLKDDPDWLRAESKRWLASENPAKAADAMKQADALAPDNLAVLQDYLDAMIRAKNYRGVIARTDPLIAKQTQLWWVYQARGIAVRYTADKKSAMEEFRKSLDIAEQQRNDDATNAIIKSIAGEIGAKEAIAQIGDRKETRFKLFKIQLYQADGDNTNAVKTLDDVMMQYATLSPQEQDATLRIAGSVYLLGKPAQVDKARDAYAKLLAKNPNDLQALNNLACLLVEQVAPPEPEEALKYSQQAYDAVARKGDFEPLISDTHGWVLVLNGRTSEGINKLREVVDRKPFLDAYYHLGEAYLRQSDPDQALIQLKHADDLVQALVKQSSANVDLSLKQKVDKALNRAREMIQQRDQAKAGG